jgi:hypothetical protein
VDLAHQLEAVDARHSDIGEHQIHRLARNHQDRLAGVARLRDLVPDPDEDALEGAPIELLVVDYENV